MSKNRDCDSYAREDKERNTRVTLIGQDLSRLDRDGIIRRRSAIQGWLKATTPKRRPHINVGKDADEED